MLRGIRTAARVALATVLLAVAVPAPAGAQSTTDSTTTTTTTTLPPGTTTTTTVRPTTVPPTTAAPPTSPPTTPATTNPPATSPPSTAAPPPITAAPATTTTVPTTTTTPPSQTQLSGLIQDLSNNVAHAQAVQAYLAAKSVAAAQLQSGSSPVNQAALGTGTVDPVLIQVALSQLKATATRDEAQRVFDAARGRIAQVGVALYLGEQLPDVTNPAGGTAAERSAFLAAILSEEQRQVRLANESLALANAVFQKSKSDADQVVNARAALFYASSVHTGGPPTSISALAGLQPLAAQKGPALSGGLAGASPSILGTSLLTADEILGWYADSGRQPHLTVAIAELVADYQRFGVADGVRWDIAIAQSVVETAYFDFPSFGQVATADNNFAGIGACDSCSHGFQYPDAATGVAAHLQLLHAYASRQPIAGPLTKIPSVSGCCPTWLALTGVWATATSYGFAILNTYRAMVVWALARRSAAAGL